MAFFFWAGNSGNHGNTNWNNNLNWSPSTGVPGSGDTVTIEGFFGSLAGNPAIVNGTGAANLMMLEGPIEFQAGFNVSVQTDVTLSQGSGLTIDPGARWQVTGDFNLLNTYQSGFAVGVNTSGSISVAGTLGVAWASNVQVTATGSLTVGSIAPAPGASQSQVSLTLGITGLFVDSGDLSVGGGEAITANGNGSITINGSAILDNATVESVDSGNIVLDTIFSSNNTEFQVSSNNAWIAIGAGSAAGGQFDLGGDLVTSGIITAPTILVGGALEVRQSQSETLKGALSGSGNLQIDSGAALYIDDAPAAAAQNTITFNNPSGFLDLASAAFGTGYFTPLIKNFTEGDVIDLADLANAKVEDEEAAPLGGVQLLVSGQVAGKTVEYQLDIAGPQVGQLAVVPESDSVGVNGTSIKYANAGDVYDWTGEGETNVWSDAGNWRDLTTDQAASVAPGQGDPVVFGELAGDNATVEGPGAASDMTFATAVEFLNGSDISTEAATGASDGNVTVDQGGTLAVSTYFNMESNANLTIDGAATIGGDLEASGDDTIAVDFNATLTVTANFAAASGANVSLTVGGHMEIDGQFLESSGAMTTVAAQGSLFSGDFAAASDGSLTVNGVMLIDGVLTEASDQTITIQGSLTVSAVDHADNVTGDTFDMTGGVFQDEGDFAGDGDTIHLLPGQFNVTGTSVLTGETVTVGSGGVFDTADGTFSGDFVTVNGGFLEVTSDLSSDDDSITLSSDGTFTVSGTATVTKDATFAIEDQSSFSAQDATFSGSAVTDNGSITVSGDMSSMGDTINVTGIDTAALFTVEGTVTLTNDTDVTIGGDATFSAQSMTLSGDTITANGSVAVSGDMSSTGDTINVTSETTEAGSASVTSDDDSGDGGGGPSFTVAGTVTLTNDTVFTIGDGAVFSAQDATFSGDTITADGSVDISGDLSSTGDTINLTGGNGFEASFTVGGTASFSGDTITVNNATVALAAVSDQTDTSDQQDTNIQINDSSSWIEIGGGGVAQGGQFGGDFIVDSGQTYSGGGEIAGFGIVVNGTLEVQSGDQEQFLSPLSGDGTLLIDSGATAILNTAEASGGVPTIDFNGSDGELTLWPEALASNTLASTIDGFAAGDKIDIQDLTDDSVTFSVDGGNLVATFGGVDQLTFQGTSLEGDLSATSDNSGGAFVEATTACFRAGTRLRTPDGEIAVEHLRVGDRVVTMSGKERPVRWIGRRTVKCRYHPDPRRVWPIRVVPGVLGSRQPIRDLFLSPDHAVFVGGALIPVKYLMNGRTITQVPVDEVTYYHIELDQHDIVAAEGLACESYLDVGDRANFANNSEVMRLFPDFSDRPPSIAVAWETSGCAPLIVTGPRLEAARAILDGHAARTDTRHAEVR